LSHQTLHQKDEKQKVIEKFKQSENDTGSCEVQASLLTKRINELTGHLKTHKKDFSCQRGLLKDVGQRRRVLDYLKLHSAQRYFKLIEALELRK